MNRFRVLFTPSLLAIVGATAVEAGCVPVLDGHGRELYEKCLLRRQLTEPGQATVARLLADQRAPPYFEWSWNGNRPGAGTS